MAWVIHTAKSEDHGSREQQTNASALYKDALKSAGESLNEPLDGELSSM